MLKSEAPKLTNYQIKKKSKRIRIAAGIVILGLICLLPNMIGCDQPPDPDSNTGILSAESDYVKPEFTAGELPKNITWLTNETDPVFSSPNAKKGGVFHSSVMTFPLTFRVVGPDSNSSFRSAILDNQLGLIGIHPNTEHIIPEIATHWAFGNDKKQCTSNYIRKPVGRTATR